MSKITVANLIGCSPAFEEAVELIRHIAETDAPVLIEGETGTGKEVARKRKQRAGAVGHGRLSSRNKTPGGGCSPVISSGAQSPSH